MKRGAKEGAKSGAKVRDGKAKGRGILMIVMGRMGKRGDQRKAGR